MKRARFKHADLDGWDWFEAVAEREDDSESEGLALAFARCFSGGDGALVLRHLRETVLDRRLGPGASDAELRFLEGQRSVAAHILSMIERGRG